MPLKEFYDQQVNWSPPFEDGLERATVVVPRDYSDPDGPKLTIAVARLKATDPAKRRGVLLAVNGGPGGDGGDGLGLIKRLGKRVRTAYDLIGFDPRGYGESTKLYSEVTIPKAPFDSRPPDSLFEQLAEDMRLRELGCEKGGGELRPHITTRNTARDMDLIRVVLGEEKISFVGYAYGTYVGAVYGTMFPENLDRTVLDSCINPQWTWREQFVTQAEAVYRNVALWAEWTAQRDGHFHLGTSSDQVIAEIEAVVEKLEEGDQIQLRTLFDGAVGTRSTDRAQWDSLGYLIGDLRTTLQDANYDKARSLIVGQATWRPQDSEGDLRVGVLEAITLETYWPQDLEVYYADVRKHRAQHPYGYGVLRAQPWVGAFRTFESLEPPTKLAQPGYPKGLVVQADGDPMDRVEGGIELAALLDHPLVLVEDSGDHEVYGLAGNEVLDSLVDDYLVDGALPASKHTRVPGHVQRPNIPKD